MKKIISITVLLGLALLPVGCTTTDESSTPAPTNEAPNAGGYISVDSIALTDKLPKTFAVVPPKGKEPNIVFEKLKERVESALMVQGYLRAEAHRAEVIIPVAFSSNTHQGQIVIEAYDAAATKNTQAVKKDGTAAPQYKLLAKTLIYYVSAKPVTFSEKMQSVMDAVKGDILTNIAPTKYYKEEK